MGGFKGLFGSKKKDVGEAPAGHPLQSLPLTPGTFGQFPATFNIYYSSKSKDWWRDLYIITTDDASGTPCPLYSFTCRQNKVRHTLTLYAGPDPSNAAVLAGSGNEKKFRGTVLFAFAPFAGASAAEGGKSSAAAPRFERMTHPNVTFTVNPYSFTMAVGEDQHVETFEWQSDNEHKGTAENPYVIRLYRQSVKTGADDERGEVVAVWEEVFDPVGNAAKMGTFSFHGSGATGDLGPHWTLMAVTTFLRTAEISWGLNHITWKLDKAGIGLTGPGIGTA